MMMMMMMMMMMYTYGGLVGAEERSYIDDHLVLIWIHQQQGGAIDDSPMVMCTPFCAVQMLSPLYAHMLYFSRIA